MNKSPFNNNNGVAASTFINIGSLLSTIPKTVVSELIYEELRNIRFILI